MIHLDLRFMNDEQFCQAIGCTTELKKDLAKKIRDVTAALCKVDASFISPNDDTDKLSRKVLNGWDDAAFLLLLERAIGFSLESVQLPSFTLKRVFVFYKVNKPVNYGEWAKAVADLLAQNLDGHIGSSQLKDR